MLKRYKLKDDLLRIGLIAGATFVMIGCNQIATHNTPADTAFSPSEPTQVSSIEGDATEMTQPLPTPADSGRESLIKKAKEDLAKRLSVITDQIRLFDVAEVTWPDSSIGCPQEGMVYAQVLTPGFLILLEHNGNTFEYHASKGNYVITCTNPSPPVPGMPDNT